MKTVYQDENNVVLDENSVEWKLCINRESKSLELTIYLYNWNNINMKFLVFITPPSIYQYQSCGMKERNIVILIMLWLVQCYVWFLTLGHMSWNAKIIIIFRWLMLSKVGLLDHLTNSYMKLSIRSGANIQISIIRMIILTETKLSGTVKIFVMVIVIYGIINTPCHPPKFLVF